MRAPSSSSHNIAFRFAAMSAVDTAPIMLVLVGFSGFRLALSADAAAEAALRFEVAARDGDSFLTGCAAIGVR
jgi:hypothetical protein